MIIWSCHEFSEPSMPADREEDHRSVLASKAHLQEDLELPDHDRDAAHAVAEGLRDAKAANTRRLYGSAWHEFCVWALESGRQSLPAEPRTVALYLDHLAADGKAMATIALARAAISHAHAAAGIAKGDNPARHPVVAEMIKGWRNQVPAPKQAGALTAEACRLPGEEPRQPGGPDVGSVGAELGHFLTPEVLDYGWKVARSWAFSGLRQANSY